MSNNTTIRARFSTMVTKAKSYTVEGIANIKAAQQFAKNNNLCLEDTSEQPATKFKIIPLQ